MKKAITQTQLKKFAESFCSDEKKRIAMNAAAENGVVKAATNNDVLRTARHEFSVSLEQGKITNQKHSGRCWMFAALNTMRFDIIKKLDLETFELSQNYTLFYDKLEKANYFLENILSTLDEPTEGRLIHFLLGGPEGDGGQWDMFCSIVEKYGVVPKDAMPETAASSETREIAGYLTKKLREYACRLREEHRAGKTVEELRDQKEEMLSTIYDMLCIALGTPPESFTFEARSKKKEFIRKEKMTGVQFFEKYVGWDLSEYVSIINAPTADKPYNKTYTVKMLGNVEKGRQVKYLNLPVEELKAAAIAQLKAGEPVWFGCDVGQNLLRDKGIMAMDTIDAGGLFGSEFKMNKAQRLDYGESVMTHAMVFQGVNLDKNGKPNRWRVENSWGKDSGVDGYYVMSDEWFSEYTYQVVINKKYLTKKQLKDFEQEPIMLEPWDPMGSLA